MMYLYMYVLSVKIIHGTIFILHTDSSSQSSVTRAPTSDRLSPTELSQEYARPDSLSNSPVKAGMKSTSLSTSASSDNIQEKKPVRWKRRTTNSELSASQTVDKTLAEETNTHEPLGVQSSHVGRDTEQTISKTNESIQSVSPPKEKKIAPEKETQKQIKEEPVFKQETVSAAKREPSTSFIR